MKNFEKNIDKVFGAGDCAIYKLRMGKQLHIGDGCDHKCKECQQDSKKWLLEEAKE